MNKRIIYTNDEGGISVIVPAVSIEVCIKDVPEGKMFEIVDAASIPADRTFRNAWEKQGASVVTSLTKAKLISHDKRRVARSTEFAPLDIQATIPAQAASAETARQAIRAKYDTIQTQIYSATDVNTLKTIVSGL